LIDRRAALLSLDDTVSKVFDPYAFIRDAFLQRRAYLISDGKVTDEAPLEDPGADEPPADTPPPDRPAPVPPPP
jgi:phospholipid-binding lipoprotein MlaA